MKRSSIFAIVGVVCLLCLAGGAVAYYFHTHSTPVVEPETDQPLTDAEPAQEMGEEGLQTNAVIRFVETTEADTQLVGYWQNVENPNWYKAYYDDEDEDEQGVFWGKEWDETDGVLEEDLAWHGNGWYKWQRTPKGVLERYRMDINESEVPYHYNITFDKDESMIVTDVARNRTYHFNKVR